MRQNTSPLAQEKERLQALRSYTILDTPPEPAYDRIVLLTAKVLGVPAAAVSFVDEKRRWFKARCGLQLKQAARTNSFCDQAIQNDETLVVPNAARDPRFAANPLVIGKPFVRFFAGAPLITPEGFRIGSLSIFDFHPRRIAAEKLRVLRYLADLVMSEMATRRTDARDRQLAAHVGEDDTGVALIDVSSVHRPITYSNRSFLRITGHAGDEVIGRSFHLLFGPGSSETHVREVERAILQEMPFRGRLLCYRKERSVFWSEMVLQPLRSTPGEINSYSLTLTDVTARLQAEEVAQRDRLRLNGLAANVPGMVFEWLTYRDGTPRSVSFVSEGCRELFGLDPATLQTEPDFLLHRIPAPDRPGFAQSIADSAATLQPWRWRGRVLLPGSDQERWLQASAQPERLPGGDLVWACLLMDVTHQWQTEQNANGHGKN